MFKKSFQSLTTARLINRKGTGDVNGRKFGAPLASLLTSCQRVWVPRWKPMPMQLTTALSARVVASAAVEP